MEMGTEIVSVAQPNKDPISGRPHTVFRTKPSSPPPPSSEVSAWPVSVMVAAPFAVSAPCALRPAEPTPGPPPAPRPGGSPLPGRRVGAGPFGVRPPLRAASGRDDSGHRHARLQLPEPH